MKVSDIIRQVNRNIKASNGDILDLINRCLGDLALLVKKESSTNYTIVSGNSYALPADFHELVDVVMVNTANTDKQYTVLQPLKKTDYTNKGYKIWGGNLSLQNGLDSGEIDFFYYRKLTQITTTDQIPEVDEPYHDLFIHYTLGNLQYMEDDYEFRPDALGRYYQRKDEYQAYLNGKQQGIYEIQVVDY